MDIDYWQNILEDNTYNALIDFVNQFMRDFYNQRRYKLRANLKYLKAKAFLVQYGIWEAFATKYRKILDVDDDDNDDDLNDNQKISVRHKSRLMKKLLNLILASNPSVSIVQELISLAVSRLISQNESIKDNLQSIYEPIIQNQIQQQLTQWRCDQQRVIQEALQNKNDMLSQRKSLNARITVCSCLCLLYCMCDFLLLTLLISYSMECHAKLFMTMMVIQDSVKQCQVN